MHETYLEITDCGSADPCIVVSVPDTPPSLENATRLNDSVTNPGINIGPQIETGDDTEVRILGL